MTIYPLNAAISQYIIKVNDYMKLYPHETGVVKERVCTLLVDLLSEASDQKPTVMYEELSKYEMEVCLGLLMKVAFMFEAKGKGFNVDLYIARVYKDMQLLISKEDSGVPVVRS